MPIQVRYTATGIWRGPIGRLSTRTMAKIVGEKFSPPTEEDYEAMGAAVVRAVLGFGKKPRGMPLLRIEVRRKSRAGSLLMRADVPDPLTVKGRRALQGKYRRYVSELLAEYVHSRAAAQHATAPAEGARP